MRNPRVAGPRCFWLGWARPSLSSGSPLGPSRVQLSGCTLARGAGCCYNSRVPSTFCLMRVGLEDRDQALNAAEILIEEHSDAVCTQVYAWEYLGREWRVQVTFNEPPAEAEA